jgi:hypothetical protein
MLRRNECEKKDDKFSYRRYPHTDNVRQFVESMRGAGDRYRGENAEKAFSNFFTEVIQSMDRYIPVRKVKCKMEGSFACWATPGILVSRERLFGLYKLRCGGSQATKSFISSYSGVFKRVCDEAKRIYNRRKVETSNNVIKTTWKIIRTETGRSCGEDSFGVGDDDVEAKILVDKFNNYFANSAEFLTKELNACEESAKKHLDLKKRNEDLFEFKPVNSDDIIKICKDIKQKESIDLWHMSTKFLNLIIADIAVPLSIIINKCLEEGVFPNVLKKARIIPIFKKGDKCDPGNYRPISILPVLSKILEKIVAEQLTHFLDKFKILHPQQFGFQKQKSTSNAIAHLVESVLMAFEDRSDTYGIFCDLSKAFDCVDHGILLRKLDHYGIRGVPLGFFVSYLSNRQQMVDINGVRSSTALVKFGVPQGSILGPLLFLIYVNDLPLSLNQNDTIVMFADDTSLLVKYSKDTITTNNKILESLFGVSQWFDDNNLLLNLTKTSAMHFSLKRSRETDVVVNSLAERGIETNSTYKFLGVTIDRTLQWSSHIASISPKLCSAVYAIKKIKDICGTSTARSVYFAYFQSILAYGILFWGRSAEINRIFTIQKRALRALDGLDSRDSCRDAFRRHGILTMSGLFIYECLIYAHKNLKNTPLNQDFHKYDTRKKNDIRPINHRLAKVDKSFVCLSVRLYNKLTDKLKSNDLGVFRRDVKSCLVDKSYYTVDEMLIENDSSIAS